MFRYSVRLLQGSSLHALNHGLTNVSVAQQLLDGRHISRLPESNPVLPILRLKGIFGGLRTG